MNNLTIQSAFFNDTNHSCLMPLFWTQEAADNRKSRLIVCIIASLIHGILWLQVIFCSSVRQTSMQWIYAYLITDVLLLLDFFFIYVVHTTSTECEPPTAWVLFVYYVEATVDNYLNILEVYILFALNVCRYAQIAYNRNVYRTDVKLLVLTHASIYILPLIWLLVQFIFGWCQLVVSVRDVCQVMYTNVYVQIFNIIFAFALPIFLNILVIYLSVRHVRLTSTRRKGQHHVSACEKYNRSLVIQFLIFYIIWVALWSPNVIVFQVSVGGKNLISNVRLLNFIEIAFDPIIIAALDVRFWQEWRKVFMYVRKSKLFNKPNTGRIQPSTMRINVISLKAARMETAAL